ncbi:hypothetical protein [Georgenia subflava]|uniref:Uncharacterized protein n=1 Tax=Georgenia subflava TaxID=1622177 RepID=A0A6N7EI00_9MICO|nr:hypothetical protein [Georgenia subflava]MPV36347.1 hypothetical protein [Georgenia subflava]
MGETTMTARTTLTPAARASAAATPEGGPATEVPPVPGVLDLTGRDHEECRRILRATLRSLGPGDDVDIISGPELTALRYEIDAVLPPVYRWSLPSGTRARSTTVVTRL